MPTQSRQIAGGPDVIPNPLPEPDPHLPEPDPAPEPAPAPPIPEPSPADTGSPFRPEWQLRFLVLDRTPVGKCAGSRCARLHPQW